MPTEISAPEQLALSIAAEGFFVFSCRDNKQPCYRGWQDHATNDPQMVRSEFGWHMAKLVGVRTGTDAGLVVVDIDVKHGPCAWHEENLARLGGTRRHQTRSGGYHYLFRPPAGLPVNNSESRIAPGVDVRGEGGYVIWAGNPGYTLDRDLPIRPLEDYPWLLDEVRRSAPPKPQAEHDASTLPGWLVADLAQFAGAGIDCTTAAADARDAQASAIDRIGAAIRRLTDAPPGTRNYALARESFLVGGLLAAAGLRAKDVITLLVDALSGPGLDRCKDWETAERGLRRGAETPLDPLERDARIIETYRIGHRLLSAGPPDADYRAALHLHNRARPDPLPPNLIDMFARRIAENHHAE